MLSYVSIESNGLEITSDINSGWMFMSDPDTNTTSEFWCVWRVEAVSYQNEASENRSIVFATVTYTSFTFHLLFRPSDVFQRAESSFSP